MGLVATVIMNRSNGEKEEMPVARFVDTMVSICNYSKIKTTRKDMEEIVENILYKGDVHSYNPVHQFVLTYLPLKEIGKFKIK